MLVVLFLLMVAGIICYNGVFVFQYSPWMKPVAGLNQQQRLKKFMFPLLVLGIVLVISGTFFSPVWNKVRPAVPISLCNPYFVWYVLPVSRTSVGPALS